MVLLDTPPSTVPGESTAAAASHSRRWPRRPLGRHAWATVGIGLVAAVFYTWSLSSNGMANSYYAAAVKAGTVSWKALLFGSLDPGSFTTVDKPPAALWVMELSTRIFGFSSWSMLLPEAAAGVASVLIVHRLVRRWAGDIAAHLSALAFALTPVAVVMFRFNNPDALLTLLCLGAAWAVWAALEQGRTRALVVAGVLIGVGFDTKMLQALLVLPALAGVYLLAGPPRLGKRLVQLLIGGVAMVVAGGWWVAVVALWPAQSRPYIGSTSDNSILSLIFGYNGLDRLFGSGTAGGGGGGGANFGGTAGYNRLWNSILGGEIAWFIPMAAAGLLTGLWLTRRGGRRSLGRAGWLLWGGWAVVCGAIFSLSKGTFHPYYVVQLAPAVAVLAGTGAIALWQLGRRTPLMRLALPAAVVATAAASAVLLGRHAGYHTGLRVLIGIGAGLAAAGLWLAASWRHRPMAVAAAVVATLTLLAGPAAYAVTTISSPITGSQPTAGPAGTSGGGPGDTTTDTALVRYLESHQDGAEYLAVTFGSGSAAGLIIATAKPVMTIGGFTGSDPDITLAQFEALVASGQIRYVILSGGAGPGGGPGGNASSSITDWVESNGKTVTIAGSTATVYAVGTAA